MSPLNTAESEPGIETTGYGVEDVDIIVIGAGLGGASAASVLAGQGRSVALVDTHAVCPPTFRAEKFGDPQIELFKRLGLADVVRAGLTIVDRVAVYRFGAFFGHDHHREYSFSYADLINRLRSAVPPSVRTIVGRVGEISTGPDQQVVTLADGQILRSRLILIATGHGDTIKRKVGIKTEELSRAHSLSLGFNMTPSRAAVLGKSLTFFGSGNGDRISYITLFPIGATMRANLFVYREAGDAWTRQFCQSPSAILRQAMPEIEHFMGSFDIKGPVEVRPIHLTTARDHRIDGVALIGDAFAITCPIPGVGIQRVLTDVERLCSIHIPRWLATAGMDAAKIGQFYDDPIKQACDARGMQASLYARQIMIEPGLIWKARRWRNQTIRRAITWARQELRVLATLTHRAAGKVPRTTSHSKLGPQGPVLNG